MKTLVLGSSGFVGRNIREALSNDHEVYGGDRNVDENDQLAYHIDLMDRDSITKVLNQVRPQIIINCAGVIENSDKASINPTLTSNIIESVMAGHLQLDKLVITGSAAEYGVVREDEVPVNEVVPLRATSPYGLSKVEEIELAMELQQKYQLPIVIARIFNPIGAGMHPRLLIPGLIRQVQEVREGSRDTIEVTRLDSLRDYIDVRDVAMAFKIIIESDLKERVYNIGSGKSTSSGELIELVLKQNPDLVRPKITETATEKEPLYAGQADTTRLRTELGWAAVHSLEDTIKDIIHAAQ